MKELAMSLVFLSLIPVAFAQEYPELEVKVEVVANNLTIPWSIDWLPDGTILFTERNGDLRIIQHGVLLEEPLLSLSVGGVEGGMLGIIVDPDYSKNNYIYLYYTYNELLTTKNKLVRYQFSDGILVEDKILIDGIPGGPFHDGGRIQFGPDGKLYVTTGEAGNPDLSQDLNSLGGKILRINSDGSIPDDNPWKNSPIYSIGHRNPQGIDWDESGNLFATEHGPSGWRGVAHDEVNQIIAGKNYGWPDIIGDEKKENLQNPILHSGKDTWAPSGAEFYYGDKIPQWNGKYFVAALRGSHLHMIEFDLQNNSVTSHEKLFQDEFGRLRDVQTGPDGFLYILTSNQDGRGTPKTNDDKILKIVPLDYTTTSKNKIIVDPNPIDFREPRVYVGEIYAYAGLGLVGMIIGFFIYKKLKNRNMKET
jgi:glucose/arabinose dehydrogenase